MADNFGDPDHRKVLGVDDGVTSRRPHALTAYSEELQ
jgi:hypothetical protein